MTVDRSAVERFAAGLDALAPGDDPIGLAVSGGPDSLALLLLAAAARPGQVEAATVDHGLRPEAADEARMVADLCARLGVPHRILTAHWDAPPDRNVQARAREVRYRLLEQWTDERALSVLATAHHADDQAETMMMRLARGSGLSGLSGIRPMRELPGGARLIRPLLGWRKAELVALCADAGLIPADDPSNRDPHHDRVRARAWLAGSEIDAARVSASADALGDADAALEWTTERLAAERLTREGDAIMLDAAGLPRELVRRLLLRAFAALRAEPPRGPDLVRAIAALAEGRNASLCGLLLTGGARWRIAPEPARRN